MTKTEKIEKNYTITVNGLTIPYFKCTVFGTEGLRIAKKDVKDDAN
jgi:hypothetical protein